jgi:hypothetical protein
MKVLPFLISTFVCAVCLVLSVLFFFKAGSNRSIKEELIKQQTSNQDLQAKAKEQDEEAQRQSKVYNLTLGIAQLRQGELQRMQQVIETGASVAQKLGPQILNNIGYLAAKNNNEKLKALLIKQNWKDFIPTPEKLKAIEEQMSRSGQTSPASAPPSTPPPSTPPRPVTPPR